MAERKTKIERERERENSLQDENKIAYKEDGIT
jgi:hypothetical protein